MVVLGIDVNVHPKETKDLGNKLDENNTLPNLLNRTEHKRTTSRRE